jgi:non-ribosomal peptide synthetase component F
MGRAGLYLIFEYQTDLFAAATIARMVRHFAHLLQQMVDATPDFRVRDLMEELTRADNKLLDERQETVNTLKQQKVKNIRRASVRGVLKE